MSREEEILNALKVLQEECKRHEYCNECPLSCKNGTRCCVTNPDVFELPDEWKLNTPEKTWNAFIQ